MLDELRGWIQLKSENEGQAEVEAEEEGGLKEGSLPPEDADSWDHRPSFCHLSFRQIWPRQTGKR